MLYNGDIIQQGEHFQLLLDQEYLFLGEGRRDASASDGHDYTKDGLRSHHGL